MKISRLIPMLPVRSMPVSVEFYQRLGFRTEQRNDHWRWAMLSFGECRLMVDESINVHPDIPRASVLYLYPEDISEFHAQMRRNGLSVPDLEVTFYGMTELRIDDPDGNRLWIGQDSSNGADDGTHQARSCDEMRMPGTRGSSHPIADDWQKTAIFDLSETLDVLERTPVVLSALLADTSSSWHSINEGADTWSAYDVIGHFIHGEETDWVPRSRIILEHGEARPFEPFNRFAQLSRFADWSLEQRLGRFAELRQANLVTVRGWHLSDTQLNLTGRHPELGTVNLRQLFAAWVVHDFNHIAQIARVMAGRYTEEVGVWRNYLSILNR